MVGKVDREELAWAAGFFDGEGHIGLIGDGRGVQMAMPQIDSRPLARFQHAILGLGKIRVNRHSNPRWKNQWVWYLHNFPQAQAVIAMLWAFLSEPKREQAKAVLCAYLAKPHYRLALCRKGHSDWKISPSGKRYCRRCAAEATRRHRARIV